MRVQVASARYLTMKGGTNSTAGPPLPYSATATTSYSSWNTRKMKGWSFELSGCASRSSEMHGRLTTRSWCVCQCVTRSRVHASQSIYVKSRMWRYDHVWGVEDRCAISDVAISGHPLAHTGNVPLPAARYRDPDAGVGQLGAGALVRSRRRAGRLSRILMSC